MFGLGAILSVAVVLQTPLASALEAPKRGVKRETSAKACRGIKRASTCRDKGCKWTKHKKKGKGKGKKCEAWPFSKKKGKKCKGKGKKSKKCKKKKPPPDNDEPVVVENYAAIYKASAGETLTWSMKKDGECRCPRPR